MRGSRVSIYLPTQPTAPLLSQGGTTSPPGRVTTSEELTASQQPRWPDIAALQRVRSVLSVQPPLVDIHSVRELRQQLGRVASGEMLVIQAGDCAEDPAECSAEDVASKRDLLGQLAGALEAATSMRTLRVGRIAGQFAKPRSSPVEISGEREFPAFRGHMVNDPQLDEILRQPDPLRILACLSAAKTIMVRLGWRTIDGRQQWQLADPPVWTSHEALLLDYETSMVRTAVDGSRWLSSTHWPWIGDRTRDVDGPHVRLLADMSNPLACKVGPATSVDELLRLCEVLDPGREPGRLTLISRMGSDRVADRLPRLIEAVRSAGHPAIWLCDPMHGNTVTRPGGHKTRLLSAMTKEVQRFRSCVHDAGGVAGGLHLEATPRDVTECVDDVAMSTTAAGPYRSFCDPRLNRQQALDIVSAWTTPPKEHDDERVTSVVGLPQIAPYDLPTEGRLPQNVARWKPCPERAVLLIHDMQTYFLDVFAEPLRTMLVNKVAELHGRCTAAGVPIAYTAQPGSMTVEQRGLLRDFWGPGMRTDMADRQIAPELAPPADAWVFTKWRYSAFVGTDLLERMRREGRDQLIVCGVYAHIGVLATTVDAFSNDIETFVVADALGDFSAEFHEQALHYVAQRCGMVVQVEDVLG